MALSDDFFKEFAITLTTAIGISLFVSLTLTPMMCAHLLKGIKPKAQSHLRGFGKLIFRLQQGYSVTLQAALRHKRWIMAIFYYHLRTECLFIYQCAENLLSRSRYRSFNGICTCRPKYFIPIDERKK
ncbi:multidrug efflux system subunit MdtC [Proteus mirabilis]|uniref:Multidrug efflux system subunit MdtC n=1 Tax=Proteus mirabilis TaxID=584 RepID=A0A2X2C1K3_PROMI|nr:multidrug efflux system subunit MdtC [Proteus mirabilis]